MTQKAMRKNKLPKPGLQFRLSMFFVSIACVAAIFQVFLINRAIMDVAKFMPNDNKAVLDAMPDIFYSGLMWTVLVLMPVMLMFGMLVTFRIAGPVYRIEKHLNAIADGEDPGDCRLRRRDELHDLCDAVNRGVNALRAQNTATNTSTEATPTQPTSADAPVST